ncbi:hypothetical protein JCGZ_09299 [Jatropha curcas]|uniref:Uncharacterized protein n=2 Tax=Jatropha curcas TaxID=180498 RepID=A0A067KFJ7_JATCU|nr:putative zinc finger protein At1g68190 isoform X2 [Jatropha curcas]KDP35011.1 hypothetical protein JCGZ_09299 [Jatropha curcas]
MFLCRGCDQNIHGVSSQHQKRLVSSFMGCPSAKDFAGLWGFKLDEVDKNAFRDQLFSTPRASVQPNAATIAIHKESCRQIGSSSRTSKISLKGQGQQNNGFILLQILDLKKLQLTEIDNSSPLTCGLEETDVSSSIFESMEKFNDSVDLFQNSQDPGKGDCPLQELNADALPSSFSQPEHLPLSSTAANPLLGESFWQCKSPVQSNQLWSQNMQDLGVCEHIVCHDDINIPDVDLTFRNFEELFGGEQDPVRAPLDDKDASCSSLEKDMSLDTLHNRNARKGTSIASSAYISRPVHMDKDKGPSTQVYTLPGSLHAPRTIQPSYSAMSFSVSRLSAESSATEYIDSGFSPYIIGAEVSCRSPEKGAHSGDKENAIMRHKEKKMARMQENQIRYGPKKTRSDVWK